VGHATFAQYSTCSRNVVLDYLLNSRVRLCALGFAVARYDGLVLTSLMFGFSFLPVASGAYQVSGGFGRYFPLTMSLASVGITFGAVELGFKCAYGS